MVWTIRIFFKPLNDHELSGNILQLLLNAKMVRLLLTTKESKKHFAKNFLLALQILAKTIRISLIYKKRQEVYW